MDEFRRSRFERRKRKRKDSLLNGLIGIVVLLIVLVGAYLFMSFNKDDDIAVETNPKDVEEEQLDDHSDEEEELEKEETVPANREDKPKDVNKENDVQDESSSEMIVENGDDENIIRTIINPNWEPIGTVQEGEHVMTFSGIDWDEMVDAISYATNLHKEEMTIHWLGNNGYNKAVGTVYTKNKRNIYRVYIEWVDGKGWKPTKVEELREIIEEKNEEENL